MDRARHRRSGPLQSFSRASRCVVDSLGRLMVVRKDLLESRPLCSSLDQGVFVVDVDWVEDDHARPLMHILQLLLLSGAERGGPRWGGIHELGEDEGQLVHRDTEKLGRPDYLEGIGATEIWGGGTAAGKLQTCIITVLMWLMVILFSSAAVPPPYAGSQWIPIPPGE
ncbi:hypothetical protein E2C01_087238 [Portunus trituberculatus]|uniref:Uncharacterized protein n=1 Tax=Portunus trituberculatus TaxID=210409 RepID=A0A5B7JDJ0_PORTR|nr:hypothetical protein [Portunus trituberculatus]